MDTVIWKNDTFLWAQVWGKSEEVTFEAKNFQTGAKSPIIVMHKRYLVGYVTSGTVFKGTNDEWRLVLDRNNRLYLELHIGALNEKN